MASCKVVAVQFLVLALVDLGNYGSRSLRHSGEEALDDRHHSLESLPACWAREEQSL